MPPKKKSGKKKGDKSGKKSATKSSPQQGSEQLNELSREFYLIQIKDLENRLLRYQKKCDELEVSNNQFREQYDQNATDKKEIVTFLKKSLEARGDEISDLNDRLFGLQQVKDSEKEQYETQLQQLRTEYQEMKDQLTSENMILGGKLASLEEFKVQKEDLMAKFAAMEESLRKQKEDHNDVVYNLERKQVVDKDRLKKEMVMRVNQVAAEFRKVSNKQMAETTKRTIRENVSINAQLSKMSDKTMEMISEMDDTKAKEKSQKQLIDMLETNEKELAKKNHSNQKIIRMLTEKCKNQEQIIAEFEVREQQFEQMQSEADLLKQQVSGSREEVETLVRQNEELDKVVTEVRRTIALQTRDKSKLEQVLADAADALRAVLTTRTAEDAYESTSELIEKRDHMLENLLVLLNSAAALGLGPAPAHLSSTTAHAQQQQQQHSARTRSPSQIPGSGKGIRKGELPMSPIAKSTSGTLPHYQLGDLGLIPRPKNHLASNLEKMKELSTTTRMEGIKKVLTKDAEVQTISASKSMFFADQLLSKIPQTVDMIHEFSLSTDKENRPILPAIPNSSKRVSGRVF